MAWAPGWLQHYKKLRHSFDAEDAQDNLTLLSAWANDLQLSLGQEAVPKGTNEIGAMNSLLAKLELGGTIVTIVTADAMHCQVETVQTIRDKKADYLLTLKGNQPTLFASVSDLFAQVSSRDTAQSANLPVFRHEETDGSDHGRVEVRRCHAIDTDHLLPEPFFPYSKRVRNNRSPPLVGATLRQTQPAL